MDSKSEGEVKITAEKVSISTKRGGGEKGYKRCVGRNGNKKAMQF